MRVITIYEDGREIIVTYVSTSGLQKQSNKAGKGQINNQIIETSYWIFEFAWQNNTNADFPVNLAIAINISRLEYLIGILLYLFGKFCIVTA